MLSTIQYLQDLSICYFTLTENCTIKINFTLSCYIPTFQLVRDLPWYRSTLGVARSRLHTSYWTCSPLCVDFHPFLGFLIPNYSFGWETIYYYICISLYSIVYSTVYSKFLIQDTEKALFLSEVCLYIYNKHLPSENHLPTLYKHLCLLYDNCYSL